MTSLHDYHKALRSFLYPPLRLPFFRVSFLSVFHLFEETETVYFFYFPSFLSLFLLFFFVAVVVVLLITIKRIPVSRFGVWRETMGHSARYDDRMVKSHGEFSSFRPCCLSVPVNASVRPRLPHLFNFIIYFSSLSLSLSLSRLLFCCCCCCCYVLIRFGRGEKGGGREEEDGELEAGGGGGGRWPNGLAFEKETFLTFLPGKWLYIDCIGCIDCTSVI